MSNSWFRFKQFTISQDKCAMKVTTDACLQGAWTPIESQTKRVLDIGTGTGLLSLMIAQRQPAASIDAVEYDPEAAIQAADNFDASPWQQQLRVTNCDIKDFYPPHQYDLIICNPPFFSNSLLSGKASKDRARHDISLSQTDLAKAVATHLHEKGLFSILLPSPEYKLWVEAAASAGLMETRSLHVRHTPTSHVKRIAGIFERSSKALGQAPEVLTIKDHDGAYTDEFRLLLEPFYLAF